MSVVALITARGGSKGIPRKNLVEVAGRPMLAWTIDAARGSRQVTRTLLSTDSEEIAEAGRTLGAEVPFLRPPELATDDSTSFDVAAHALRWLAEQNATPEYLLLLQPTSPLRTAADIDAAIGLARSRQADAVLGVCEASPHPYLTRRIDPDGTLGDFIALAAKPARRQDFPPAYVINGAIYLNRPVSLLSTRSFQPPGALAFVMPRERSIDIDTVSDLKIADFLLRESSV